jgi:cbb3-type cytochrome oxidase maturation protein
MDVIYSLIPGMIFFGLIFIGVLIWAVKRGQYDDLEGDGNRILMDDDDPLLPENQKKLKNEDRRNWPDAD